MSDAFGTMILIDHHVRERCERKKRETSLNSKDNFDEFFMVCSYEIARDEGEK